MRIFLSFRHDFPFSVLLDSLLRAFSGFGVRLFGFLRAREVLLEILRRLFQPGRKTGGRWRTLPGTFRIGQGNPRNGMEVFAGKPSTEKIAVQGPFVEASRISGFPFRCNRQDRFGKCRIPVRLVGYVFGGNARGKFRFLRGRFEFFGGGFFRTRGASDARGFRRRHHDRYAVCARYGFCPGYGFRPGLVVFGGTFAGCGYTMIFPKWRTN